MHLLQTTQLLAITLLLGSVVANGAESKAVESKGAESGAPAQKVQVASGVIDPSTGRSNSISAPAPAAAKPPAAPSWSQGAKPLPEGIPPSPLPPEPKSEVYLGLSSGLTMARGRLAWTAGPNWEFRLPNANGILGIHARLQGVFGSPTQIQTLAGLTAHPPLGTSQFFASGGFAFVSDAFGYIVQFGGGYDFRIKEFTITPYLALEITDGNLGMFLGATIAFVI